MSTRQVKDAIDLTTNEPVYLKGHAKATYMSNGSTVEDAIIALGNTDIDIDVVDNDIEEIRDIQPNTPLQYLSNISTNKTFILNTDNLDSTKENIWKINFIIGVPTPTIQITSAYNIYWANGIVPTFEPGSYYELTFRYLNGYFLGVCGIFS